MNFSFLTIKNDLKTRDWKWLTKIICFIAIIVLIVTDQIVKWTVQKQFDFEQEYDFIPGFINLKYVKNKGSAFGFLKGMPVLLILLSITISIACIVWLLFTSIITRAIALSFFIAGAIGNLMDRFLHDGVVDFLAWKLFWPYTIFNVADMLITVGVIISILHLIIVSIINIYQEKNGEQNNDRKNQVFTTIIDNKSRQVNKTNISCNSKRTLR